MASDKVTIDKSVGELQSDFAKLETKPKEVQPTTQHEHNPKAEDAAPLPQQVQKSDKPKHYTEEQKEDMKMSVLRLVLWGEF
ncbi:hypothetical protein PGQ11_015193 [Apiospora arundinis]|uniref:Uncharacterized protein n=1 Tax=Apiospora arundinis TaxID=335852 RepID=A0ABR2HL90_9PEZI